MTTAARPTFEPARGGRGKGEGDLSALSKQYSSRDLPGHTKIKYSVHTNGKCVFFGVRVIKEREQKAEEERIRGTMMSCLKTALKEWMNHVKRNASLMTPCALNSIRNSWRNMLNNCLVIELYFSSLFKIFFSF
uniref:CWC15 spliceosome associated protein homolog n=1 Tax=Sinocyclocheilus anshuiensis TaxID=1608454 RepID=A0A671KLT5_9TELE